MQVATLLCIFLFAACSVEVPDADTDEPVCERPVDGCAGVDAYRPRGRVVSEAAGCTGADECPYLCGRECDGEPDVVTCESCQGYYSYMNTDCETCTIDVRPDGALTHTCSPTL